MGGSRFRIFRAIEGSVAGNQSSDDRGGEHQDGAVGETVNLSFYQQNQQIRKVFDIFMK